MVLKQSDDLKRNALIFGASGAIGAEIYKEFQKDFAFTYGVSRSDPGQRQNFITWSPDAAFSKNVFSEIDQLHAVIWAQGANCNDTIYDFNRVQHLELYEANVIYILESLRQLLDLDLIAKGARLCIISSIWQEIARQNKLSYTVTKSALRGLVQSLAIDLGEREILVNAVLPGALETPMTRANLSRSQIEKIENETPLKTLPQFKDVCALVSFLCSSKNTGITGQFIAADRGYSCVRFI